MKSQLIFNLPEDEWEFKRAINGADLHIGVQHVYNTVKSRAKHSEEYNEAYDEILSLFIEHLPGSFFEE